MTPQEFFTETLGFKIERFKFSKDLSLPNISGYFCIKYQRKGCIVYPVAYIKSYYESTCKNHQEDPILEIAIKYKIPNNPNSSQENLLENKPLF